MYVGSEIKKENTLKVEFHPEEIIRNVEFVEVLKKLDINLQGIIGFYESEKRNEYFVKFKNNEHMQKSYNVIEQVKSVSIDKKEYMIKTSIVENLTKIKIHNLPFELSDEIVVKKLEKFGKIYEIQHEKVQITDEIKILNGIRIVTIKMNTAIPPYMNIQNIKARIQYRNQKEICFKCMSTSHHRKSCTEVTNTHIQHTNNSDETITHTCKELEETDDLSCKNIGEINRDTDEQKNKIKSAKNDCKKENVANGQNKKKKNKYKISNEVLQYLSTMHQKFEKKPHENIKLDFQTSSTYIKVFEMFLSNICINFCMDEYPTNNTEAKLINKTTLDLIVSKTSKETSDSIKGILEESSQLGVKLTWFLIDKSVYFFVN